MNRKRVAAWVLFDFANSVYPAVITATVFALYYANTIVGNDAGRGDLWWGRVLAFSMFCVAVSSPVLGSVADKAGVRKKFLIVYSYLCIVSVVLFTTLEPGMVLQGFLLAVLANIGFEGSLVYYNAYLADIAPPERQGFVSGLGFGVGYAGSIVGLLIALLLMELGLFYFTWLAVAGFFALFSLPSFLGLPSDVKGTLSFSQAAREGLIGLHRLVADVLRQKPLRRFLLSFFVYIDGVNTTLYFAGLYTSKTLGFSFQELIYLFLLIQASALVGALVFAKPTDLWGPKLILNFTLVFWTLIVTAAYFIEAKSTFFGLAVFAGTGMGVVQAASRAMMASLIPKGKEAEMFGFYAFCGKSSSILGPLLFGFISHALGGNQRVALLSIIPFFFVGFILLQRVKAPRPGQDSA